MTDTVAVKAKPIHKSLTVIFNVAAVALVVLLEVQDLATAVPEGIVPEWATKALVAIISIVNIILRIRTKIPVAMATTAQSQQVPAPPPATFTR